MAAPRVFISSTCFDFAEVRDSLISFCQGFGFDVVLSEKGDVFYHPDLHTHESCVNEISNCQLFILIIGGRFGGKYRVDPQKSITNAEYISAKELGIPVFTFVKETVLADHHVFQKNKDKKFSKEIEYPSIENQNYAENIFEFIDAVRSSNVNNGFFPFRYAKELHENLRKQWAAMFFDFLSKREVSNQLKSTSESITNLSIASKKIEELIKQIYRQVDSAGAEESILAIDEESEASKFFERVAKKIDMPIFVDPSMIDSLKIKCPNNWWDFLLKFDGFEYINGATSSDGRETDILVYSPSTAFISDISGEFSPSERKTFNTFKKEYEKFVSVSELTKQKILEKYSQF